MIRQSLTLIRGDSRTLAVTATPPASDPTWTLSDATGLAFSAACAPGDDAIWSLALGDGITVTDDLEAEVAITPALWDDVPEGLSRMAWDLEGTDPDGTVTTLAMGTIVVVQDVTR